MKKHLNKISSEINWAFSTLWVILASVGLLLGVGAFLWKSKVAEQADKQTRQLNMRMAELQSALGPFANWGPDRLQRAETMAAHYAGLAFSEATLRQVINETANNLKWHEFDTRREPLVLGLTRYRSKQVWGDTLVSDWLPVILPSMYAWERGRSPVGVEAVTIRTRGGVTQRSFDRIEVALTGIIR